jgi:pimeloyl-ACP methyl ester carboxylesterase
LSHNVFYQHNEYYNRPMNTSTRKSDFVHMNGINLHYLDWGGDGDTLLFLPGLGNTAYVFDKLARRFTDMFHVLALTRRGHGDSDTPETGYDLETLTEDLKQFLDVLRIDKVILAGSSMAHVEICHFSALCPERVLKIVYLDAAYDHTQFKRFEEQYPLKGFRPPGTDDDYYSVEDYFAHIKVVSAELKEIWGDLYEEEMRHEIKVTPEGKIVDRMSDELNQKFINISRTYLPEDSKTTAPVLSFYAIWDRFDFFPAYLTEEQKAKLIEYRREIRFPIQRELIEKFRQQVPHARIIEISKGHHWCFIKHEELVYEEMRKFLLE